MKDLLWVRPAIALNRTPGTDCYKVGAGPKIYEHHLGFRPNLRRIGLSGAYMGFPKIRGTLLGAPIYDKDYRLLAFTLGPLFYANC